MSFLRGKLIFLSLGIIAGASGGYWYALRPADVPSYGSSQAVAEADGRRIIYYRDPTGAPYWSATPKKDARGDYLPVYEGEDVSFEPPPEKPREAAGDRRIIYYRNPMGLPDTSPVPKKDWMGMDYIPVYEGEEQDDGSVTISQGRIQRSGVRTETAEARVVAQPVRAVGTVKIDERRLTVIALRSDGYIEDLFVNATGQSVRRGESLFRVYSPQIQQAQIDLIVAIRAQKLPSLKSNQDEPLAGPLQRLRNLGVPESRIQEVREVGTNPRTIDWPAPVDGTVIEKKIVNGQRVMAGDELYRLADLSQVWIIADVSESDLAAIKVGMVATIAVRAYPQQPIEGKVTFIYPELRPETRTARIRIEAQNPEGRLKPDMYADVIIHAEADDVAVVAVPDSAVIDSGARQVVLVAKGEGRFEPRNVKLGRRGAGYIEILDGISKGEEVVTSATFLIDAESNLRAALKAFTQPEAPK